jgi:hypothetical protein
LPASFVFKIDEVEMKFLSANSTSEFSHSLDPKRRFAIVNYGTAKRLLNHLVGAAEQRARGHPRAQKADRFDARTPSEEPGALAAPAGICAGGGEQSPSLPRPPAPGIECHGVVPRASTSAAPPALSVRSRRSDQVAGRGLICPMEANRSGPNLFGPGVPFLQNQ